MYTEETYTAAEVREAIATTDIIKARPARVVALALEMLKGPQVERQPEPERAPRRRVAKPAARKQRAPRAETAPKPKAPKPEGGKRHRADPAELEKRKTDVMLAARKHFLEAPFSKSDLEQKTGEDIDSRTLSLLVEDGKLTKTGERRMTKYTVA